MVWFEVAFSTFSDLVPPGYDKEGAEDLRHRLSGTQKWIGTAGLSSSQFSDEMIFEWRQQN